MRSKTLLTAAFLAAIPAMAAADTVATNFGPGDSYQLSGVLLGTIDGGFPMFAAVPFVVPAGADYRLDQIRLPLVVAPGAPAGTIPIHLAADAGGAPGPVLETFTVSLGPVGHMAVANSVIRPGLTAGAEYWIVVPNQVVSQSFYWQANSTGAIDGYSVRSIMSNWIPVMTGTASRPAFKVEGTPSAGACCNTATGACALSASSTCNVLGMTYLGTATVCSAANCATVQPVGACCRGGVCEIATAADCDTAPRGTYLGVGSVCAPAVFAGRGTVATMNACCRADYDHSGSVGVQDIFDYLAAYFGGCP